MVCPRCSSNQSDDIKFCTSCGANLQAVREALETPEGKKFDWGNTWVADMFISGQVAPHAAEIITRIWVAGIIPIMVGLALIVNGVVVSKKIVEAQQRALN